MSAPTLNQFQQQVSELLLRHRSLLDVMSKYGQSGAAVNRAVTKAVTDCGCIELNARKQQYAKESNLEDAKETLQSHLTGEVCEHCRDALKSELGRNLFYMTALCNHLDIKLDEVIAEESNKCSTLGLFNLT
jgi:NTP pyrophosphatase (non-canonical NTP hydrolase)